MAKRKTKLIDTKTHTSWTSHWMFLLAVIGSSIGLGNIWKFPYEMGAHGGGTFLLVYIPCVLLVALPVMMSEIMIGRYGGSNPVHGLLQILKKEKLPNYWRYMGWIGMLTGFLVFTYYSVVAAWILFYIMQSITGSFVNVPAEIVQHSFGALLRDKDQLLIWHTVFVLLVVMILSRGLRVGLERALLVLVPCFVALLVWLFIYASQVGDFDKALDFVFSYDLAEIDAELIVSALTQALFSLSVGIGALVMFGAYLSDHRPIATASVFVMVFDTAIALIMALMIFSIVFAYGMQPDSGAGLIFETLPVAFSQMTSNSVLWSTLFFTLLGVAALTSAFSLLEPSIAWVVNQFNVTRRYATWSVGFLAWVGGLFSIYSFNDWKFSFYYFNEERIYGMFDVLNIVTIHFMIPLVALLATIFAGWKISRRQSQNELSIPVEIGYRAWRFCSKIFAPALLTTVLIIVFLYPA